MLVYIIASILAGCITGILGSGGGLLLVPFLSHFSKSVSASPFQISVCIMLPICISALVTSSSAQIPLSSIIPYVLGGLIGGLAASRLAGRFSPVLLHRILGLLILWGGWRYLCS